MASKTPWQVRYQQFGTKRSRPKIYAADGKTLRLSKAENAELAAMAPDLARALDRLADRCDLLYRQLKMIAFSHMEEPAELTEAKRWAWRARVLGKLR